MECYFLTKLSNICCRLWVCPVSLLWSKIRPVYGWLLSIQDVKRACSTVWILWRAVGAEFWLYISNIHFNHEIFLLCAFSDVQWGLTSERRFFYMCYIHRASPLCVISDVWQGLIYGKKFSHIHYTDKISLLCEPCDALWGRICD